MNPNYNLENEISDQYGLAAIDFRTIATKLLTHYKAINQKEFEVVMWQACNLVGSSKIRLALLGSLKEIEMTERLKELHSNQTKMKL